MFIADVFLFPAFKWRVLCICVNIYIYTYTHTSGCPSDPMITFDFYNSSMNTEVAPQPQSRCTVLNMGGETGSQLLWSLPKLLCGVSLWQQWVSRIEPLRSWQQLCEPSLTILVCPWHIPSGLSDWCDNTGDWLWPCLYTAVFGYLCCFIYIYIYI